MVEMDRPVECGGVLVHSGDIVFGDVDGVVVIPSGIAEEVIARARRKVAGENSTRAELAAGVPLAAVFAKFGIL